MHTSCLNLTKGTMSQVPDAGHTQSETSEPALIEIGWVLIGTLDDTDHKAVLLARDKVQEALQKTFPAFIWRMPVVQREELARHNPEELVVLLEYGIAEREAKHWDFAFVITDVDLVGHYKSYALGAPGRSVSVAVMSTARLDPRSAHIEANTEERLAAMARRITALAMHHFGHLNGLAHHEDPMAFTCNVDTVDDLDRMQHFPQEQIERLATTLHEVADVRLEEQPTSRTRPFWFYVRAVWINLDDIVNAALRARPWEFPFRLSRLTTAAMSALLILLVTAEVWEVGMNQPPELVVGLSLFALVLTSSYVLKRQRLLAHRRAGVLSEQTVMTNVSIIVVVLLGMLTTYVLLFLSTMACSLLIFRRHVIIGWAASINGDIQAAHYVVLSAFVASLGLLIGALGASFEQHYYFRHITYIDEET